MSIHIGFYLGTWVTAFFLNDIRIHSKPCIDCYDVIDGLFFWALSQVLRRCLVANFYHAFVYSCRHPHSNRQAHGCAYFHIDMQIHSDKVLLYLISHWHPWSRVGNKPDGVGVRLWWGWWKVHNAWEPTKEVEGAWGFEEGGTAGPQQ